MGVNEFDCSRTIWSGKKWASDGSARDINKSAQRS